MNRFTQLATVALATLAATAPAVARTHAAKPIPKLNKIQAAAIARKAVPNGTIVASELEAEKGGTGLRYSFDVKVGKVTREIGVDANTGVVLENAVEGAHPD